MTAGGGEAFWEFALSTYARDGVAADCLALQDRCGANVMLLMFLCWRAAQHQPLDTSAVQRAGRGVAVLERNLALPLRRARCALAAAARNRGDWPWLQDSVGRLRAAELAAERLQARALARCPSTATTSGEAEALARVMLASCLGALQPAPEPQAAERLAALALGGAAYSPG